MNTKFIEITEKDCQNFINLAGEQIQVIKRQHPFILAVSIFSVFSTSFLILILGSLLSIFLRSVTMALIFSSFIIITSLSFLPKAFLDWYYHLYVITSRKILEIRCVPFFSDQIDDVFLDQIRTTEIDAHIPDFLHELLDMGDVTIAFDRPSHDEVYTLSNIRCPREVASLLGKEFEEEMTHSPVWFKPAETPFVARISEDIYPAMKPN